jgi:hypothetical protein
MDRPPSLLAYWLIVGICVAGALHASWWAAIVGGCGLALALLVGQRPRLSYALSSSVSEPVLVIASLINASVIACGAYIFGYVARLAWGL